MNKQELIKALEPFPDDMRVLMSIQSESLNFLIEGVSVEEDYHGNPFIALNEEM